MENKHMFNYRRAGHILTIASLIIIPIYFYLYLTDSFLFHITTEFTIVVVGVISALIGILTAHKSENNLFSRISPALFYYSVMTYVRSLSFPEAYTLRLLTHEVSINILFIANLVFSFGLLWAVLDKAKKISITIRFWIFSLITVILCFWAFTPYFPTLISGDDYTLLMNIGEAMVIATYVSTLVLLIKDKDFKSNLMLRFAVAPLVLIIISELFFIKYHEVTHITVYFGLIIRILAFVYYLYQVIKSNLLSPYNSLIHSLIQDKERLEVLSRESVENYFRLNRSQEIGHVGTWELDLETNLIWASDEAFRIYGAPISDDNLIGLAYVQQTAITPDRKKLDKALKDLLTQGKEYNLNFRIIDTDDELHYIHSVATLIKDEDGNPKKVSGVIHDITKLKLEQDKLLYSSTHDHLTNVYNRRYFSEQRMLYDDEKYLPVSFAILDINGLKIINDSLGHHAGNEVLKRLAQVLERHITDGKNFVSRIGGDEFSIFFANTTHEQAEERMQHILDHLSHERIGNIELSIAYGIAVRETMDQSVDEVLKKAEDEMYLYKISDSQSVRNKIIDALLKTLYEKDNISEEHSQRVSDYAFFLAKACNLSNKRTNDIKTAGLLHDIGKIMISNDILNKEGKLTASEYNIIKTHPEKGYRIIHSIGDMDIIANHVHQHHERIDGIGYPKGLKGDDISLEARIIAIADAYDAMTSYRDYKAMMTTEEATMELIRCKGTQFDSELVDLFIKEVLKKEKDL